MFEQFKQIHDDMTELSRDFKEKQSIKNKEEHETKRQLILDFFNQQKNIEYNKIKQIKFTCLTNRVEDYVSIALYDADRIMASINSHTGIDFVDGIHDEVVEDLFRFMFNKIYTFKGVEEHTTLFFHF